MSDYSRVLSTDELDSLFTSSGERPVLLFKHSLTCPISSAALREYERHLERSGDGDGITYTLIEVQNARDVSNLIAERTGVRHESPQALVLRDGNVSWHASHWSITADALGEALAQA